MGQQLVACAFVLSFWSSSKDFFSMLKYQFLFNLRVFIRSCLVMEVRSALLLHPSLIRRHLNSSTWSNTWLQTWRGHSTHFWLRTTVSDLEALILIPAASFAAKNHSLMKPTGSQRPQKAAMRSPTLLGWAERGPAPSDTPISIQIWSNWMEHF